MRVSPRPAENVRYSPEIQEQECRRWADDNGHEVVGVVSDILVSGGSRNRFDSILTALDELRPDAFICSDLSRWTRDTPTRFYAIRSILEDAGVRLISVTEPFVGSDQPFADTITTAVIESNLQQRLVSNRKTSAGVRKAWAEGKRPGHCFGWTWHPPEPHAHDGADCPVRNEWTQDREMIESFYADWMGGVTTHEMSRRYGLDPRAVRNAIRAKRQADVIGHEAWLAAQGIRRSRSGRRDAKWGNVWRGLLVCPFCGRTMQHSSRQWGQYLCPQWHQPSHRWTQLSARRAVVGPMRSIIERITLPEEDLVRPARRVRIRSASEVQRERDRLTVAWAADRLSQERYDSEMQRLDAELTALPEPEPDIEVVREMSRMAPFLDCTSSRWSPCTCERCPRQRPIGDAVNDVLRALLDRIEVTEDQRVVPHVREGYRGYVRE